jgi:hypothetical protein
VNFANNATTYHEIPMGYQNVNRRTSMPASPLSFGKPSLNANNGPIYARLWESGEDLDSLLGTLMDMGLPQAQQDRLLRRLTFNLQPGVLAPHLQAIYDGLLWLELPTEEFQEALDGYDISEEDKDAVMDFYLWKQLVDTL